MITIENYFRNERRKSIDEMEKEAEEEKAKQYNTDPLIAHVSELMNMPQLDKLIMAVN